MPNAGVSVSPGRTYRGEEDPETGEGRRQAERRTGHTSSERTARLPRDGAGRAIRPPHVRLASMADVTAELDFTPRPRARRTSGPAASRPNAEPRASAAPRASGAARTDVAPRSIAAARATTAPRPIAAEIHQSLRPFDSERASQTAEPAVIPGSGVSGRRTVTIHGRGAERYSTTAQRRRPARRLHERDGFRPDRVAMWAVMLGFILVLVAATSSHAATITHRGTSGTSGISRTSRASGASGAERHVLVAHHGVHGHTASSAVRVRLPVR